MATKTEEMLEQLIERLDRAEAKNAELEARLKSGQVDPVLAPLLPAEQDEKVPEVIYFSPALGYGLNCPWRAEALGRDPNGNIIMVPARKGFELKFRDVLDPQTRLPDIMPRFRSIFSTTSKNEQDYLNGLIEAGDRWLFRDDELAIECHLTSEQADARANANQPAMPPKPRTAAPGKKRGPKDEAPIEMTEAEEAGTFEDNDR